MNKLEAERICLGVDDLVNTDLARARGLLVCRFTG